MKEFALKLSNQPVEIPESTLAQRPVLTHLGGKRWRLEQPYWYQHGANRIVVPAEFVFDLASVPRPFWWAVAPFDLSIAAPLLHDFLYRYAGRPPVGSIVPPRTYTRKEADDLFKQVMKEEGVRAWRRAIAYQAVRAFGGGAWGSGGRTPEPTPLMVRPAPSSPSPV